MRQYSKTQRRLAVGAFLITAGPVALGSAAYACQSIVTAQATPNSVSAGNTITVSGANYSAAVHGPDVQAPNVPGGPTGNSPIEIRLNERDGRVIGTGTTGATRKFSTQVTIPNDVAAGVHTLIIMQYRADGVLISGGPGRVSVTVTAAGGSRTAAEGTVAAPAAAPASGTAAAAPAAAAPVASAPAAAAAETSAARDAGTTAAPAAAAAATSAAPVESVATAPAAAAAATAPVASPDAASPAPASSAASSLGSLVPASSESSNVLPGLTLAVGLALVLLSLGAFVKSGRNMLGRNFTPLAG